MAQFYFGADNHGRCIAFTIKALGYPVRESLRSWNHESHPELHVRIVGRSNAIARPPAMKQAAVIGLCTRQESAQAVAQELGVCRPTLYWKNQLVDREVPASMKRQHDLPPGPEREDLERQLEALRRDIRRLMLLVDALRHTPSWNCSTEWAWHAVPISTSEPGSMLRTSTPRCVEPSPTSSSATTVAMATAGCRLRWPGCEFPHSIDPSFHRGLTRRNVFRPLFIRQVACCMQIKDSWKIGALRRGDQQYWGVARTMKAMWLAEA